ncbi:MAG: hypothetical protein IJG64_03885 [Oscillospiraceae bacterium]|nr:hypothetical protein [Oscillospiraceae bacterium]MBQ3577202.1 hypothetical protein [Bacillota bacterium]
MNHLLNSLTAFMTFTLLAIGGENAIFTRALGLSSGLRVLRTPKKDTLYFCTALTFFQIINSLLAFFVVPLVSRLLPGEYIRFVTPVIIVVLCALSYIIVAMTMGLVLKRKTFTNIIYSVTGASINSAIVGTIIYSLNQGLTFSQTMGYRVGTSVGYFLAMLLIEEGQRKIRDDLVPKPFKGLPVMLVYISILALAIYGLTGHTLAL